jgi:ribosome-associated protein
LAILEKRERLASTLVDLEAIRQRALLAAKAASDVKADEVKILDMHELVTYTDFLVLCTGRNARLTRHVAEEVAFRLKTEAGVLPVSTEGAGGGEWILLDFLDFIVHIFTPKAREFYRLDVLWKQAPVEAVT